MSYGSRKRGYDQGVVSGGFDLRLRRIRSSPSQTLRRRLVRTTDDGRRCKCSTLAAVRRGCFSQFATRTVDNTIDMYAAKPDIRPESRFLPTTPAFDAPVTGVPVGISPSRLVQKTNKLLYNELNRPPWERTGRAASRSSQRKGSWRRS